MDSKYFENYTINREFCETSCGSGPNTLSTN